MPGGSSIRTNLVAKWQARAERLARRSGVTVRPFRTNDFAAEVGRCQEDLQRRDGRTLGLRPSSPRPSSSISPSGWRKLAMADQVLLAEVDGRPVGFSITLPDINEAIRPLNGRLTRFGLPLGLLRFLRRKRHIKTARMVVLDVLKEYRRRGIAELLILRTLDYGKNVIGYTGAELGWTLEDNDAVNRTIEAVGGRRYKTYRMYEKPI